MYFKVYHSPLAVTSIELIITSNDSDGSRLNLITIITSPLSSITSYDDRLKFTTTEYIILS